MEFYYSTNYLNNLFIYFEVISKNDNGIKISQKAKLIKFINIFFILYIYFFKILIYIWNLDKKIYVMIEKKY